MNRPAYNKMQADIKKQQAKTLQKFRESNPKAYERLLKKAREEVETEFSMTPLERLNVLRPVVKHTLPAKEFSYNPQERHYYIYTRDDWNKEHLYFHSFTPTPSSEEVLDELHKLHPKFSGIITSINPCSCPACSNRHLQ